jgi:rhodanese-related sulfurtransferase
MSHKRHKKGITKRHKKESAMHAQRYIVLAFIVSAFAAVSVQAQAPPAPAVATITAEELKTKVANNQPVMIIDVRSSQGYAASTTTVKGALHFKVRKLKSRLAFPPLKDLPKDREIVTYCACPKDESSIAAAQVLQSSGFTRVRVLQGGWTEWLRVNGPTQPKPKG